MTLKSQAQSSPNRLTFQPLRLQFILSSLKITTSGLEFSGLSFNLILKCDLSEFKSHMNPSRKKSGKLPLLISIQSPISALLYVKSALKAPLRHWFYSSRATGTDDHLRSLDDRFLLPLLPLPISGCKCHKKLECCFFFFVSVA